MKILTENELPEDFYLYAKMTLPENFFNTSMAIGFTPYTFLGDENPKGILENGYAQVIRIYSSYQMLYNFYLTDSYSFYFSLSGDDDSTLNIIDHLYIRYSERGYVTEL